MEVSWLRLPPANLVLYLDLPPHAAFSAMKADPNRGSLDIHETAQRAYKENVRKTYLWCCENMSNWFHTNCCDCAGSRLSREETHNKVYEMIERQIIPIE
ncbi:putative thymidylate kinase [Trypanosoma cruzi]|nr:putative thymidylate kinase [Trypanosoma cruzi]